MYMGKFETFLFGQGLKKWDMFKFIKLVSWKISNQNFKLPNKKKLRKYNYKWMNKKYFCSKL